MGRATHGYQVKKFKRILFQSTPSVGRATLDSVTNRIFRIISIHALRGEGDFGLFYLSWFIDISIHALRGEGDNREQTFRHSARISIHALRGEGDLVPGFDFLIHVHFNPRPPWGGRRLFVYIQATIYLFQSTPSVGRATRSTTGSQIYSSSISIHALRGEGDK